MATSTGAIIISVCVALFFAASLFWMIESLKSRNECGKTESPFCPSQSCSVPDSQCNSKPFRLDDKGNKICQQYLLEKFSTKIKPAAS